MSLILTLRRRGCSCADGSGEPLQAILLCALQIFSLECGKRNKEQEQETRLVGLAVASCDKTARMPRLPQLFILPVFHHSIIPSFHHSIPPSAFHLRPLPCPTSSRSSSPCARRFSSSWAWAG